MRESLSLRFPVLLLLLLFCEYTEAFVHRIPILRYRPISLRSTSPFVQALVDSQAPIRSAFFFPGHDRGSAVPSELKHLWGDEVFRFDLPELDETDNLHAPTGPLLDSLRRTAALYSSERAWYLVNGCTGGNHVALLAMARRHRRRRGRGGEPRFLVPRDSHKSVFDALRLADAAAALLPCGLQEDFEVSLGSTIESIGEALETHKEKVCGLVLTRPGYHGAMHSAPCLRRITELCHQYDVPVLVDESHGSHLRFLQSQSHSDALECGADIVVQSAHKTLNALSQTGFLHLSRKGNALFPEMSELIDSCFSMITTTSPNTLLLASLDATQRFMHEQGHRVVRDTACAVDTLKNSLRSSASSSECVKFLEDTVLPPHIVCDPMRLSVQFVGQECVAVDEYMCKEHGLYCELNQSKCIVFPVGIGKSPSDIDYLQSCLLQMSERISAGKFSRPLSPKRKVTRGQENEVCYLRKDSDMDGLPLSTIALTRNSIHELAQRVSAETITMYPPGIPFVLRGEHFSHNSLRTLLELQQILTSPEQSLPEGCSLVGNSDSQLKTLKAFDFGQQ